MSLAAKSKEKVERLHGSLLSADQALKGYLQIKTQAEKNDISIDEMILYLRHQSEGEVALRISPEIDGQSITSANSQYAASLMDKPFALGGGSINQVVLQNDKGEITICTTANEFRAAKAAGLWPLTLTAFSLTNRISISLSTKQSLR